MSVAKQITNYLIGNFENVRTTEINNSLWYAAIDITAQLDYSNNYKAIKDHCNVNGVQKVVCAESGRPHPTLFINDENLCRLVLASKMKKAKKMQEYIFNTMYSETSF